MTTIDQRRCPAPAREGARLLRRFAAVDATRPLEARTLYGEDHARRARLLAQRAAPGAHLGRLRAELAALDAQLGPAAAPREG